jgi:hypothetical protein
MVSQSIRNWRLAGVSSSCSGLSPRTRRAQPVILPADGADEEFGAAILVEEDDAGANLRACASRKLRTTVLPEPEGPMMVKLPRSFWWKLKK